MYKRQEQGIEKIPTQHIGVSANAMEKRGIESQRGNENREIKKANGQIQTIEILEKQTQKEIAFIREDLYKRQDDKTPQSQELRDLANTEDKYIRLAKSGYYDEKKAERAEAKKQTKEAPAQGGFAARREALKPKVQEALKKQEQSKTHDIGRGR